MNNQPEKIKGGSPSKNKNIIYYQTLLFKINISIQNGVKVKMQKNIYKCQGLGVQNGYIIYSQISEF